MESRLWSVLHVVVAAAVAVGWSMMTTFPDDDDDCDHTLPLHFHYYSPPPNTIHIPQWIQMHIKSSIGVIGILYRTWYPVMKLCIVGSGRGGEGFPRP